MKEGERTETEHLVGIIVHWRMKHSRGKGKTTTICSLNLHFHSQACAYTRASCSINVLRTEQKKATEDADLACVQGAFPSDGLARGF